MFFYGINPFVSTKHLTYAENYAIYQTTILLAISMSCFIISCIWRLAMNCNKSKEIQLPQEHDFEEAPIPVGIEMTVPKSNYGASSVYPPKEDLRPLTHQENSNARPTLARRCLYYTPFVFLEIGWVGIALIPCQFYAFGLISYFVSASLMFLTLFYRIVATARIEGTPSKDKAYYNGSSFSRILLCCRLLFLNKKRSATILTVLALVCTLFINFFFQNTCITLFNETFGLPLDRFSTMSTKFTRYFQLSQVCAAGPPCHVFATVPEDASNAVFLNVHTSLSVDSLTIKYDTIENYQLNGNTTSMEKNSSTHRYDQIEGRADRMIHTILLDNLKSNTLYKILIYYDGKVQAEKQYLTPPGSQDGTITLAFGGDFAATKAGETVTQNLVEHRPNALFMGGDIAYDNSLPGCYYAYDSMLFTFERFFDKLGHIIPMILAVGNHDIGLNHYSGRKLTIGNETSRYFTYFPQHYHLDSDKSKSIPLITQRSSVFHHVMGNTLIFTLDSGYLRELGSYQVEYLKTVAGYYPGFHKIVQYHVPLKSPCVPEDAQFASEGAKYWEPAFEELKIDAVFENHRHILKRTKKIGGSQNATNSNQGIMYFGDGAWGVPSSNCKTSNATGIMNTIEESNHVWVLNLNSTTKRFALVAADPTSLKDEGEF